MLIRKESKWIPMICQPPHWPPQEHTPDISSPVHKYFSRSRKRQRKTLSSLLLFRHYQNNITYHGPNASKYPPLFLLSRLCHKSLPVMCPSWNSNKTCSLDIGSFLFLSLLKYFFAGPVWVASVQFPRVWIFLEASLWCGKHVFPVSHPLKMLTRLTGLDGSGLIVCLLTCLLACFS